MDEVTEDALEKRLATLEKLGGSLNQAKKQQKENRKEVYAAAQEKSRTAKA